jgi:hypothetical protein
MYSTHYFCRILIKFEFSRQSFRKGLKYHVSSKSVQWEQSCCMRRDGQTDGHDEANSRILQFGEHA